MASKPIPASVPFPRSKSNTVKPSGKRIQPRSPGGVTVSAPAKAKRAMPKGTPGVGPF